MNDSVSESNCECTSEETPSTENETKKISSHVVDFKASKNHLFYIIQSDNANNGKNTQNSIRIKISKSNENVRKIIERNQSTSENSNETFVIRSKNENKMLRAKSKAPMLLGTTLRKKDSSYGGLDDNLMARSQVEEYCDCDKSTAGRAPNTSDGGLLDLTRNKNKTINAARKTTAGYLKKEALFNISFVSPTQQDMPERLRAGQDRDRRYKSCYMCPNMTRIFPPSSSRRDNVFQSNYSDKSLDSSVRNRSGFVKINFKLVRRCLIYGSATEKRAVLDAIRLRMRSPDVNLAMNTIENIVKFDLFGVQCECRSKPILEELLWPIGVSASYELQTSIARFLNALVSYKLGRNYFNNKSIIRTLTWNEIGRDNIDPIMGDNLIGLMMKLSCSRFQRTDMIKNGLLRWLLQRMEEEEYSTSKYHRQCMTGLMRNLLGGYNLDNLSSTEVRKLIVLLGRYLETDDVTSKRYICDSLMILFQNINMVATAKELNFQKVVQDHVTRCTNAKQKERLRVVYQLLNQSSTSMPFNTQHFYSRSEEEMFLDTDLESDDIGNRDSYQGESLLREKFSDDADVQCVDKNLIESKVDAHDVRQDGRLISRVFIEHLNCFLPNIIENNRIFPLYNFRCADKIRTCSHVGENPSKKRQTYIPPNSRKSGGLPHQQRSGDHSVGKPGTSMAGDKFSDKLLITNISTISHDKSAAKWDNFEDDSQILRQSGSTGVNQMERIFVRHVSGGQGISTADSFGQNRIKTEFPVDSKCEEIIREVSYRHEDDSAQRKNDQAVDQRSGRVGNDDPSSSTNNEKRDTQMKDDQTVDQQSVKDVNDDPSSSTNNDKRDTQMMDDQTVDQQSVKAVNDDPSSSTNNDKRDTQMKDDQTVDQQSVKDVNDDPSSSTNNDKRDTQMMDDQTVDQQSVKDVNDDPSSSTNNEKRDTQMKDDHDQTVDQQSVEAGNDVPSSSTIDEKQGSRTADQRAVKPVSDNLSSSVNNEKQDPKFVEDSKNIKTKPSGPLLCGNNDDRFSEITKTKDLVDKRTSESDVVQRKNEQSVHQRSGKTGNDDPPFSTKNDKQRPESEEYSENKKGEHEPSDVLLSGCNDGRLSETASSVESRNTKIIDTSKDATSSQTMISSQPTQKLSTERKYSKSELPSGSQDILTGQGSIEETRDEAEATTDKNLHGNEIGRKLNARSEENFANSKTGRKSPEVKGSQPSMNVRSEEVLVKSPQGTTAKDKLAGTTHHLEARSIERKSPNGKGNQTKLNVRSEEVLTKSPHETTAKDMLTGTTYPLQARSAEIFDYSEKGQKLSDRPASKKESEAEKHLDPNINLSPHEPKGRTAIRRFSEASITQTRKETNISRKLNTRSNEALNNRRAGKQNSPQERSTIRSSSDISITQTRRETKTSQKLNARSEEALKNGSASGPKKILNSPKTTENLATVKSSQLNVRSEEVLHFERGAKSSPGSIKKEKRTSRETKSLIESKDENIGASGFALDASASKDGNYKDITPKDSSLATEFTSGANDDIRSTGVSVGNANVSDQTERSTQQKVGVTSVGFDHIESATIGNSETVIDPKTGEKTRGQVLKVRSEEDFISKRKKKLPLGPEISAGSKLSKSKQLRARSSEVLNSNKEDGGLNKSMSTTVVQLSDKSDLSRVNDPNPFVVTTHSTPIGPAPSKPSELHARSTEMISTRDSKKNNYQLLKSSSDELQGSIRNEEFTSEPHGNENAISEVNLLPARSREFVRVKRTQSATALDGLKSLEHNTGMFSGYSSQSSVRRSNYCVDCEGNGYVLRARPSQPCDRCKASLSKYPKFVKALTDENRSLGDYQRRVVSRTSDKQIKVTWENKKDEKMKTDPIPKKGNEEKIDESKMDETGDPGAKPNQKPGEEKASDSKDEGSSKNKNQESVDQEHQTKIPTTTHNQPISSMKTANERDGIGSLKSTEPVEVSTNSKDITHVVDDPEANNQIVSMLTGGNSEEHRTEVLTKERNAETLEVDTQNFPQSVFETEPKIGEEIFVNELSGRQISTDAATLNKQQSSLAKSSKERSQSIVREDVVGPVLAARSLDFVGREIAVAAAVTNCKVLAVTSLVRGGTEVRQVLTERPMDIVRDRITNKQDTQISLNKQNQSVGTGKTNGREKIDNTRLLLASSNGVQRAANSIRQPEQYEVRHGEGRNDFHSNTRSRMSITSDEVIVEERNLRSERQTNQDDVNLSSNGRHSVKVVNCFTNLLNDEELIDRLSEKVMQKLSSEIHSCGPNCKSCCGGLNSYYNKSKTDNK